MNRENHLDIADLKKQIIREAETLRGLPLPDRFSRLSRQIQSLRQSPLHWDKPFQQNFRGHYHCQQIFQYEDREFVQAAYRALLRHGPDAEGERYYIGLLRRGAPKIEILIRLRFSAEGRAQKVRLKGWGWALLQGGLYRLPVAGYFFEWLGALITLPITRRRFITQQEMLRDHLNRETTRLQEKLNEAIREINARGARDNDFLN